jgi:hypothetical protein
MSDPTQGHDESALDQKLLGMQGFDAARAERYRAEISRLLTDRMSTRPERWAAGLSGVLFLVALGLFPLIEIARAPAFRGFEDARWTFVAVFLATAGLLGGWMLWVAIRGGYGRRSGDVVGAITSTVFGGGSGIAFVEVAWATDNAVLRTEMLFAGAIFFVLALGCLLMMLLGRMHRQTQERLLRIDYHVAELMARSSRSSGA